MEKIDFVITWVDGNDEEWQREKMEYSGNKTTGNSVIRYRDMGILRYWFRAVEKYAPWVNKVHFITWGHLPEWLDTNCEKLNVVNHKDYIPKEYLPTFSSHPIELNMHRIENLSEHFVYFNDDMLLNNFVSEEFFFKKGLPCDFIHMDNIYFDDASDVYAHVMTNEVWETGKHNSYAKSFLKKPCKFVNVAYPLKNSVKNILKLENKDAFCGFENHHLASPFLKSSFEQMWQKSPELLDKVSKNKFRSPFDVSQSLFRYYQLAEGRFYPVAKKSRGKYYRIEDDNSTLIDDILNGKHKVICINDSTVDVDFEKAKEEIIEVYERKLPDKSRFEL